MLSLKALSTMALIVFVPVMVNAHNITQTVRGKIIDQDSRMPLPGANVVVAEHENMGTATDANGDFRIENVPVGRITLAVSFIGYENKVVPNILITSGKETVLEIVIQESLVMMEAVVVKPGRDKSEVDNEMALTNVRGFTVEETKRYAGSFNDPARMTAAFAGVSSDPGGNNFIIVRGNSPKGVQWRLEGIDIPNPNHFADEGTTGGPINVLNSQMLSDSEFYTGAFPSEYGNALSGVFDMRLRKGNNEKREYSFSIGALGTDVTVEGPFVKGGGASYLVNYRYSTLSLLDNLGLADFDGVPKYQDVSFKFFLPTKSMGVFSVFGLGGKSNILEEEYAEDNEEQLVERGNYKANMGVVGVTQYWPLGDRTYFQNSVSVSQNGSGYVGHQPDNLNELFLSSDFGLDKKSFKAATTLNHKFNAQHTVQAGFIYSRHTFDFADTYFDHGADEYVTDLNIKGDAAQYQGFASWKFRPVQDISMVSGFHVQKISLNNEVSFEPRVSARWQFRPTQALTAGFGVHGKMESLTNYYSIVAIDDEPVMPNKGIGFSKARHFVAGYENKLSSNLFFKAEAYYQQLFNVPVENDPVSSYSLINQVEGFTDRILVNEGTGKNAGIELTLERYFSDNYYFLVTTSVFDSKYTALDGVERDTRFNGHLVGNVLFGKEFQLSSRKQKNKVVGVNARVASLGARRHTPINLEESVEKEQTSYHEDRAFTLKGENVFLANLAVSYRIDNKKLSQELKLDIQNVTNNNATIGYYYSRTTGKIESFEQLPLLPVISYTVQF